MLPVKLQLKTINNDIKALIVCVVFAFNGFAQAQVADPLSHEQWLKARFGVQHEKLIPIVAVADMYFSCNNAQKIAQPSLSIKALITTLDKKVLAEKLYTCLNGESVKSDIALNYGLTGCFHEQLAELSAQEKQQKLQLVRKAIAALSREERQKSFTQCVTDQAITYLK